jgi:hypothetical protein
MPESSCSFSASSVASALAAASSLPVLRHCSQSLFGSASQADFGRLPAMVVGNMRTSLGAQWVKPEPFVRRKGLEAIDSSLRFAAVIL